MIPNARSAWRKERLAYTSKLLIFASPNGTEVIDVVPFVEITGIRSGEESPSRQAAATKNILLGDDASDSDTEKPAATPSKAGMVVILQTELDGYNSGRTYRLRAATARDSTLLAEEVGRLTTASRAKLQRKSWLRGLQVVAPPLPFHFRVPQKQTPTLLQARIQPAFGSNTFQKFIALLIVSVVPPISFSHLYPTIHIRGV